MVAAVFCLSISQKHLPFFDKNYLLFCWNSNSGLFRRKLPLKQCPDYQAIPRLVIAKVSASYLYWWGPRLTPTPIFSMLLNLCSIAILIAVHSILLFNHFRSFQTINSYEETSIVHPVAGFELTTSLSCVSSPNHRTSSYLPLFIRHNMEMILDFSKWLKYVNDFY